MKYSLRISGKLLLGILMVSLLLTACSSVPSIVADTALEAKENPLSAGETVTISREEYERYRRYAELDELLQVVEAWYYQEPDIDAMIESAQQGLLYGLEDPYTFYYNPEQFAEMWEEDEGEYAGIGIQLMGSYETFLCLITRVFEGSPAHEAGLKKGDVLTMVDDLEVTAYSMTAAVDIMRSTPGTTVNIQVLRGEELLDFVIPRAVIHINRVSSCMLEDSIGYMVLYEFAGDCSAMFKEHMNELLSQGAKGLILDLRDNSGGWVRDAGSIADFFLPEGTIAYMEDRYGAREYLKSREGQVEIPLVVLINENSASASEILAGALQDYDRATLVGVKSFGKGIVQNVLPVGNAGAGMQVTSAQYFTPDGNQVHKVGITPDIEALMPEGDNTLYPLGDMTDAQLKRAHEVMLEIVK